MKEDEELVETKVGVKKKSTKIQSKRGKKRSKDEKDNTR